MMVVQAVIADVVDAQKSISSFFGRSNLFKREYSRHFLENGHPSKVGILAKWA